MKDKQGKEIPGLFIDAKVRPQMQAWLDEGAEIAIYQNVDLGHPELGHLKFLKVGPGCTFIEAPQVLPSTPKEINWRYYLQGMLNKLPPPNWVITLVGAHGQPLTVKEKKEDVRCEVIMTDEEMRMNDESLKGLHDQKAEAALYVGIFDSRTDFYVTKLRNWARKHKTGIWSVYQQPERR